MFNAAGAGSIPVGDSENDDTISVHYNSFRGIVSCSPVLIMSLTRTEVSGC